MAEELKYKCCWCGKPVGERALNGYKANKHSGWMRPYQYCDNKNKCRLKAQKTGSTYGNNHVTPVEINKRKSLCKAARKGSRKAQEVLTASPYFMTGIFNPKTQLMVRW
jgi:hypothetical protein